MRDLRRLLELYQRWQMRIFPYCGFDEFVEKLEKLSSSAHLRVRARACTLGPG